MQTTRSLEANKLLNAFSHYQLMFDLILFTISAAVAVVVVVVVVIIGIHSVCQSWLCNLLISIDICFSTHKHTDKAKANIV